MHHKKRPLSSRLTALVAIIALLGLLLPGCGSTARDPLLIGSSGPPADGFFMGRLLLEDAIEGAEISIESLDGAVHHRLSTNASGIFYSYGPLPPDFRIRAVRPDENTPYHVEVRGGYQGGTMYINPATTLVSRFLRAHPELSLQEAEQRVKRFLEIPQEFELNWITNSVTSPFAPRSFHQFAQAQGGAEEAFRQLLEELEVETQARRLVLAETGETVESVGLDFLKGVGSDLFSDTVEGAVFGIFGAAAQAMGLNLGTQGQLKEIEEQLAEVLDGITNIEKELNLYSLTEIYTNDLGFMDTAGISPIRSTNSLIRSTISELVDGENVDIPALQSDILTTYATISASTGMSVIYDYLLGNNVDNVILTFAKLQQVKFNPNPSNNYLAYPVRWNANTGPMIDQLRRQQATLLLGCNVFAEAAHLSIPVTSALITAQHEIDGALKVLQQSSAQVPVALASDELIVDLPNLTMWFNTFQGDTDYSTAYNICQNFSVGPYDDFFLPSRGTLEAMALTRVGGLVGDQDSDSSWRSAWQSYGFGLAGYGHYSQAFQYDAGGALYDDNTGGTTLKTNYLAWQGVPSNPATAEVKGASFLIARGTYGLPEQQLRSGIDPRAYGQLPDQHLQISASGTQLSSKAQFEVYEYSFFGTLYKALFGTGPSDVTRQTFWESSNRTQATVSNLPPTDDDTASSVPGPIGRITWHPPVDGSPFTTPVTFTGTTWGMPVNGAPGLQEITGSLTLTPPDRTGSQSNQLTGYSRCEPCGCLPRA